MAQLIKLKRSAVAGKVPTTGSLTSGEIAINTADGKLFYRRDDDTIQSFFTTNALITGSLQQSGSDSYFLSNVGIGTTTPESELTVNGYIQVPNGRGITFSDIGDGNTGRVSIVGSEDNDTMFFRTDNGVRMAIRNTNVGIGTIDPSQKLQVVGNVSSSDSYINDWGSISASLADLNSGANQTLQEVTDNGATTTNNITFSGDAKHIYFGNQNTFIGERSNSNNLELRGGGSTGTQTVYIDSSGNLGVGVVAPSYKLDVAGSGNISQDLNVTGSLRVQHTSNSSRYLRLGWGSIYANDPNNELILGSNYSDSSATRISISGKNSDNTPSDAISMHANNGVAIFSGSVSDYFDPQALLHVAGDTRVEGTLTIDTVAGANTDTDSFLVLDGGVVKQRTGEQVASDIGAITIQPTLQNVAAAGNTITGSINIGIGSSNPTRKLVVTDGNEYKIRAGYPYNGGRYLDIGYQAINVINPGYAGDLQIKIDGDTKLFVGPNDVTSSGSLASGKNLFVKTLTNATTDTDKFLVGDYNSVSHEVKYRTGAQVLSDIGGASATIDLQDVTDNGNVTTNDIIAATLSGSALDIVGNGEITGNLTVGGIVTAQEFHTEFVSASIVYQSGSTKFGDTSDDRHAFTGSVSIKDVPNADGDRDKFLVIDGNGKIEYRSGSQVLSDIGGTQSTFDGNRGITQTLLPSLLNFNPGTTTVEDFLDAVFYPPSPEDFSIISNEPFSVLESDEETDIVHAGTTGYNGAQAEFSIDTSATITWSLQSTTIFSINSTTGRLSLNTDLSGSATFQAPKTLTGTVVATSNGGTIKTAPFTVTVVPNAAPTITFQTQTRNNNKTTGATGFGTITITDLPQGVDTVSIDELNGADASSFSINSPTPGVTTTYILSSSVALDSGSYSLDVTGSDSYDNTVSASFTITVEENLPPVITQTGFSLETDQATSGSNVGTITVTDPQDDSIASFSFTGTDAALFNAIEVSSTATSKTFNVQPFNDLSAGSFNITGSGTDSFGFTTLEPIENEFTQPVPDAPTPNGSFYVIESAESGSFIYTNSNGFSGTKAKFTSDQTGTWSILSSNILAISQLGELSIKQHLSGSTTQAPGTLTGTVKILNSDGQSATSPISVTLVENLPATITKTVATTKKESETTSAIGLGTVVIADPQNYENVQWINFDGGGNFTTSSESPGQSVSYEVSSSGALTNGTYSFAITASDSYGHETKQLHTLVIAENQAPTITYSGFSGTVDDATSGSNVGTATVTDPDAEGITSFTLSGTDASSFNAILASSNSSTNVYNIQPNTDLGAGSYNLTGSAEDDYGLTTTKPITNSFTFVPPAPIGSNDPFYIIESALSGSFVSTLPQGVLGFGTKAKFTNSQPVTWSLQNTNILEISQSGELTVNTNISGAYYAPGTFTATVVATNDGGSVTAPVSVTIVDNLGPTIAHLGNLTFNTADMTSARGIGLINVTDPLHALQYENAEVINFDGGGNFTISTETPSYSTTYKVSSSGALTAGEYEIHFTGSDDYGNKIGVTNTITVSTPAADPITKNGNLYIIESAESGSDITTVGTGIPGAPVQFSTTTPNVTWSVTPTTFLHIDSDGYLTLQADVSGSSKAAGNTLDAVVTAGTGASTETTLNISVLVTPNSAPTVTDTVPSSILETDAEAGDTLGTITAIDPQSLDNIDSIAITGGANQSDVTLGTLSTTTYSGSVDLLVGGSNLSAGSKSVQVTATDSFGQETVHNINFTVGAVAPTKTVYVYGSTRGATSISSEANAIAALGDPGADNSGIITNSPIDKFQAGDIGDSTITVPGGAVSLVASGQLSTLTDLDDLGTLDFSSAIQQIIILFPSASDMGAKPSSMHDGTLPSSSPTSGKYALYDNNSTIPGVVGSGVYYFDLDGGVTVNGFSRWGMIFSESGNSNNATFHIIPDSGSTP